MYHLVVLNSRYTTSNSKSEICLSPFYHDKKHVQNIYNLLTKSNDLSKPPHPHLPHLFF